MDFWRRGNLLLALSKSSLLPDPLVGWSQGFVTVSFLFISFPPGDEGNEHALSLSLCNARKLIVGQKQNWNPVRPYHSLIHQHISDLWNSTGQNHHCITSCHKKLNGTYFFELEKLQYQLPIVYGGLADN